jgi:hypothetical protein
MKLTLHTLPEYPEDLHGSAPLSERNLDRARRIYPHLTKEVWGDDALAYQDDYCLYVQHSVDDLPGNRIGSSPRPGIVWVRVGIKCYPGGQWEPDEYDHVLLDDAGECFRDLASAMMESRVDILRESLIQQADNTCYACFGAGTDNPLTDHGSPCSCCAGLGFMKLA